QGFMEGHFRLRRAQQKGRIPRASIGAIEPTPQWMCVDECGIDYLRMAYPGNQLMGTDSGQHSALGQWHLISGVAERREIAELCRALSNVFQWVARVSRWN